VENQSSWETWDDNFQDLGENYKVSKKNYHFLVVEGLSLGDWPMFVEVYIDEVLQPPLLSISMKGKGSQFILDQSQLDVQALGTTKPIFAVHRLRGRGHRIRYRGYISTDGPVPILDEIGFGQLWTLEASARANTVFPAASVYLDEFTVYAFHRFDGVSINPLQYDVSNDGGQTFPTIRTTTFNPTDDVVGARRIQLSDGTWRFLILENATQAIAYSDNLLTLPTASTWTEVTLPDGGGAVVGAPVGFEVNGLNVLIVGQQGAGADLRIWHSEDGGATFSDPVVVDGLEIASAVGGYNFLASPSAAVWCLLSPNSGKIYRSTDNGATWSAAVKTITPGDASLSKTGAIFAASATRLVAVYKGQVVTSDDAGLTWTDRQNLTLVANSPVDVRQGAIAHIASFGLRNGIEVLGGATNYATAFSSSTTRGAMWRSVDLGTTWTLVNAVGGGLVTTNPSTRLTGFVARNGRGEIDI